MPRRARHEVYVKIWPRPGPVDGRGCTVMSMTIPFARMHGCGNDFVVIDDRAGRLYPHRGALAQAICHRPTGRGGDRLILIGRPPEAGLEGARADEHTYGHQ